jgi:hypothetical protein
MCAHLFAQIKILQVLLHLLSILQEFVYDFLWYLWNPMLYIVTLKIVLFVS